MCCITNLAWTFFNVVGFVRKGVVVYSIAEVSERLPKYVSFTFRVHRKSRKSACMNNIVMRNLLYLFMGVIKTLTPPYIWLKNLNLSSSFLNHCSHHIPQLFDRLKSLLEMLSEVPFWYMWNNISSFEN